MFVLSHEHDGELVKLDTKDKRIIAAISHNARTPINSIARQVGLRPDSVRYRLQRLREKEILLGARTVVSPSSMGFTSHHIFVSLSSPTQEPILLDFLNRHPAVNAVLQYLGRWDFEIVVGTRTLEELDTFRAELSQVCSLDEGALTTILKSIKSTAVCRSIFPEISEEEQRKRVKKRPKVDIDKNDLSIINTIADAADTKVVDIMSQTGLTRDKVTYRMKRLEQEGVIHEYIPVVNHGVLGVTFNTVLLNLRSHRHLTELEEHLRVNPNVVWAARTVGRWDVIFFLITNTNREYYQMLSELRSSFSDTIQRHETLVAYKEHKYSYIPKTILEP